jgi:hypothetical protein
MTACQIAVHLPDKNGMPADDTINTFTFADTSSTETASGLANLVFPFLESFYNGTSNGGTIASYLANSLDRNVDRATMVAYQLAGSGGIAPVTPLGGPVAQSTWSLGAVLNSSPTDIPRECAAVMTIESPHAGLAEDTPGGAAGPAGDTHPAARHRGRIYLGPFNVGAMGAGVNGPGIIEAFRNTVAGSAGVLLTNVNTLPGATAYWGIWSRVNHAITPVTFGHIDDAWDTQRRRGIQSTQRTIFG